MKRVALVLLALGVAGVAFGRELDGLGGGVNAYAFGQADEPGLGLEVFQVYSGDGEREALFGVELGLLNNRDKLEYTALPSSTTLKESATINRSIRNTPEYFASLTLAFQAKKRVYLGASAIITMESLSHLGIHTPTGKLIARDESTKTHVVPGAFLALKLKRFFISTGYDQRRGARLGITRVFGQI